jgi:superfamily II DNA or RNA helicase
MTQNESIAIKQALTHPNPAYFLKKRMGLFVGNTPKEISTCYKSEDGLICSRGDYREVMACLDAPTIEDCTCVGKHRDTPYVNTSFELDQFQVAALESIQKKNQGIVHAETSAGKTAIIAKTISDKGVRTVICTNRKVLLSQIEDDLKAWLPSAHVRSIISSSPITGADIYLVTDRSLKTILEKKPEALKDIGMLIVDEVHISSAPTIQFIVNHMPCRYRYGFSGTLKRKDKMDFLITSSFGRVIARTTKDDLLGLDRISKVVPKVHRIETDIFADVDDLPSRDRWTKVNIELHKSPERMRKIIKLVESILSEDTKNKVFVLSRFVQPSYVMSDLLKTKSGVITGKETKEHSNALLEEMRSSSVRAIFGTISCLSTGISISDLTHIILASPVGDNELLIKQIRGRLMRKAEGKEVGIFIYVNDINIFGDVPEKRFKRIVESE